MHSLTPIILLVIAASILVSFLRMRIEEKRYQRRRDEMEAIRVRHMNERDQRRRRFEMAVRTRERSRERRTSRHFPDTADPSLTVDDWKAFLTGVEPPAQSESPVAAGD